MNKRWTGMLVVLSVLIATPVMAGGLADFGDKPKTIKDFAGKGKWLITMIWASDCHVCNQEAHAYEKFHNDHKAKDATMLGISMDGMEKHKAAEQFIKRHKLGFPNLIGEPEDVARLFMELTGADWVGTPTFLIYDPKGELVAKQEGAVPVDLIEQFIARSAKAP